MTGVVVCQWEEADLKAYQEKMIKKIGKAFRPPWPVRVLIGPQNQVKIEKVRHKKYEKNFGQDTHKYKILRPL